MNTKKGYHCNIALFVISFNYLLNFFMQGEFIINSRKFSALDLADQGSPKGMPSGYVQPVQQYHGSVFIKNNYILLNACENKNMM
jgi:hypothetical protein